MSTSTAHQKGMMTRSTWLSNLSLSPFKKEDQHPPPPWKLSNNTQDLVIRVGVSLLLAGRPTLCSLLHSINYLSPSSPLPDLRLEGCLREEIPRVILCKSKAKLKYPNQEFVNRRPPPSVIIECLINRTSSPFKLSQLKQPSPSNQVKARIDFVFSNSFCLSGTFGAVYENSTSTPSSLPTSDHLSCKIPSAQPMPSPRSSSSNLVLMWWPDSMIDSDKSLNNSLSIIYQIPTSEQKWSYDGTRQ